MGSVVRRSRHVRATAFVRARVMNIARAGRVGLAIVAVAVGAHFTSFATPAGASACSGGIAFDWAVAHQRGGIVQAVVESKYPIQVGIDDIVVTEAKVVRGEPTLPFRVTAVAGLPCDQVADAGETILILYDIRGAEPPVIYPTYYVVSGPDALSAAVVRDVLGPTAPPTDADPSIAGPRAPLVDWTFLAVLASAVAVGAAAMRRRTNQGRHDRSFLG